MNLYNEALKRFQSIKSTVGRTKLVEPTAVTLATANRAGRPSARVVLLKGWDKNGFVFYTNFKSRKAKELLQNPWAALCFYWDPLDDQIRVEGRVERVTDKEADAYWVTRPHDSQIGAWASDQSATLISRAAFLSKVLKLKARFLGRSVPRPPFWSGFRLTPVRIEYWKRKPFRLHERILYEKVNGRWVKKFLYP